MIWFLLILVLFFGLLLWLPLAIEIDSKREVYRVSWRGILAFWAVPGKDRWHWFFKVFFWQMEWKPARNKPEKAQEPQTVKPSAGKRRMPFSWRRARLLMKEAVKAVQVKHIRVNWDTGDFVLNAWLYPAFRVASHGQRQWMINFTGEQELAILLQTRLGRIALAAMRVFITSKK